MTKDTNEKVCVLCGKPFFAERGSKRYCGPECAQERKRQRSNEYRQQEAARKRMESERQRLANLKEESIAEVNAKARAAGMSYGQYMLMQRVGRTANG